MSSNNLKIAFTHPEWNRPCKTQPRRIPPLTTQRTTVTRPLSACTLRKHVPPTTPVDYHTSAHYNAWIERYSDQIEDIIHTIRSTAVEFERPISVSEITPAQRRDIAKVVYQASSKVISDP